MAQNGTDKKSRFRRNILAALLYFGLGAASLLLELVPEIATPIWPAAGAALGAVLLWGNAVLPGILLGAICTNILAVTQAGAASSGATLFIVPLGISAAVFIQAWLGAKLVRTCVRFPGHLESGRDIALFLLLGGPVGCLISASIAVTWLNIVGVISKDALFFQYFTWWAGDTIGVLIASPLFVLLSSSSTLISTKRKTTVALPLIGIAAASFAVFLWVKHVEEKSVQLRFQAEVTGKTDKVKDYLSGMLDVLHSVSGLYIASEEVTDVEFRLFTRHILQRYNSLQNLQWVPYVTAQERTPFERKTGRKNGIRFRILEKNKDNAFVTADRRTNYFPLYRIVPDKDTHPPIGFDLGSVAGHRQALEKALSEKALQASRPLLLTNGEQGIIIVDPVFKQQETKSGHDATGFIVATVNIPRLISNLLSTTENGITVITADSETSAEVTVPPLTETPRQPVLQEMRQIDIAGRLWNITYIATPEYFSAYRPWAVWFTMIGGVAFVSLLQFLLLVITGQTSATERIVAERTQALKRSNTELEQFAYAASHDLKTPLRHISICAEFINDGDGDRLATETREYLDVIRKSTKHMSALIDSLLDYARINHNDGEQEQTSLNDVFDTVKQGMASVIAENDASITRDELPIVYADGQLLSRVFLNLLDNALKYKDPGRPPRIHVSCKSNDKEWIICASDNGIGIAPQFSEKIFEVFQRLHRNAEYSGTGIGLPACKRIIEYHKGRIWLDTDYKGGSRFCFTLPHHNHL
ncbi:MAG: hypothetical protein EP349_10480 [Alphaproteobacteria bacterium]|nr:MAG: hypothetical protein EP349_10480 [Alphaproteobacteria bacterium]